MNCVRDDGNLREKARELIQGGHLPDRHPDSMWGGPGIGAQCMVCGVPVAAEEVGIELEFAGNGGADPDNYHFHVRCYSALELEIHNLKDAGQTTSSTDPTQSATMRHTAHGCQSEI